MGKHTSCGGGDTRTGNDDDFAMTLEGFDEIVNLRLLLSVGQAGGGRQVEMLGSAFFGGGDPTLLPGGRQVVLAAGGARLIRVLRRGRRRIETRRCERRCRR